MGAEGRIPLFGDSRLGYCPVMLNSVVLAPDEGAFNSPEFNPMNRNSNSSRPFHPVLLCILGSCFLLSSEAATKLLPFQGVLSDSNGDVISDARIVQFRLYDAPVGGEAVWAGEVHRLSVNEGLVNAVLGTKVTLAGVDFAVTRYLEITVDANDDNQIDPSDPPLLPRQIVLPPVFAQEAGNSRTLQGHDWGLLFGAQDPEHGRLSLDILAKEILNRLVPTGAVSSFAGTAEGVPDGWFLCDGSALSSQDYPELFACIGTHYGNGSSVNTGARFGTVAGRTDFNIPELRGLFVRGYDPLGLHDPDGRGRGLGSRQNPGTGSPTIPFLGQARGETELAGAHRHAYKIRAEVGADSGGQIANGATSTGNVRNILTSQDGNHTHSFEGEVVVNRGGDKETRPFNRALNYIIKY